MKYLGKETQRVDGVAKVTGRAKYAVEFQVPNCAYGYIVTSTIAKGTITSIDTAAAEKAPGVIKVLTHKNATKPAPPPTTGPAPARKGFFALVSDKITFNAQPIALVLAETFEEARYAASLVKTTYREEKPSTDLVAAIDKAYDPQAARAAKPRGNPTKAYDDAKVKIEGTYTIPIEHHNPMEMHGGIGWWEGDKLIIFNKSQNVYGDRAQIARYFGIPEDKVSVSSAFVGGAFGASLRPNYYSFLLGVASKAIGRPVKISYTRRQMFTGHGYRPFWWQKVSLAADEKGTLQAIKYTSVINSSSTEEYTENFAKPARTMYACPNVETHYKIVQTDLPTPAPMRAPAMVSAMTGLEIAMDELAYAAKIDPLELRLINYAETDPDSGKPYSSKALRECYKLAAETFGWSKRNPEPGSMKDGRMLVGWGMATGTWAAMQQPSSARVILKADGTAHVSSAASDIGPGTYTVMTMIAAEYLGLPPEKVKFELGDTKFVKAPAQGGSWTTASVGTAIYGAAQAIAQKLLEKAQTGPKSPLAQIQKPEDIELADGQLRSRTDPKLAVDVKALMKQHGLKEMDEIYEARPDAERNKYFSAAHGAQFVEVKIDPDTGMIKVTRVIEATACGKIMNPLTSHSQEMGGVVWGIGMALHEATEVDHRYGRMMNASLADYHVPVNADVHEIKTMFVEEDDKIVNPLGVKGMGELGMVGIPAAICNAVFHATGKRVRDLPITPDKIIG